MPEDGAWLRVGRARAMLTQEELAERAGVDARTIRDIETGRTGSPRPSTVRLLKVALASSAAAEPGPRPRELPPDTFGFAGRYAEITALDRLLDLAARQPTAVVIAAVSGTAGVGKTALAVHWAHRVAERFPDGQLYVNLRGYDPDQPVQPSEALAGFLRSLGVAGGDIPAERAERARRYRTLLADRRMLILADNAFGVEQVVDLLPGTPASIVVVTSRDSLAGLSVQHGAHRIDLDPLPASDSYALLRTHLGKRVDTEPEAAATVAEHCAHLPLALRIAAQLAGSRPAVTLAELAAELADEHLRLDLLDAGDQHSSARAVFSWSYQYLPEQAAELFRLLGSHPGQTIDPYACAALAGTDPRAARRQIAVLNRAHLIQETSRDRYGMHDLLRAYAASRGQELDPDGARRLALGRVFDYYLQAAYRAADRFAPYERHRLPQVPPTTLSIPDFPDRTSARTWLDAERHNLIAVAVYAADNGWTVHTRLVSTILFRYLSTGAHYVDAELLHGTALRVADPDDAGQAVLDYALVLWRSGHHQEAFEHFRNALELLRAAGDRFGEGRVLTNRGTAYLWLRRYAEALEEHHQALRIFEEIGDRWAEARARDHLGVVYQRLGRYAEALEYQQQAVALYQAADDPYGEAGVRGNLGVTYSRLGRYAEALDHHQHALASLREMGDRRGEAETLNDMGTTLRDLGSPRQAIENHREALTRARDIGDRYEQGRAHDGIAQAAMAFGDAEAAQVHRQAAVALYGHLASEPPSPN